MTIDIFSANFTNTTTNQTQLGYYLTVTEDDNSAFIVFVVFLGVFLLLLCLYGLKQLRRASKSVTPSGADENFDGVDETRKSLFDTTRVETRRKE